MLNSDFTVADRVTFISMRGLLQLVFNEGKWKDCLPTFPVIIYLFCMPSWSVMPHCRFIQVKCLLVFEIVSSYDLLSGDVSTIFTDAV